MTKKLKHFRLTINLSWPPIVSVINLLVYNQLTGVQWFAINSPRFLYKL